jgi:hypothetical protein
MNEQQQQPFTLTAKMINRRSLFENGRTLIAELSFPAAREEISAAFDKIGVAAKPEYKLSEINSGIVGLPKYIGKDADIDELNYLAAKVNSLPQNDYKIFCAVAETEAYCRSAKDFINLTEYLDNFYLQPAYDAEQYGEFLREKYQDETSDLYGRMQSSADTEEQSLAKYVALLEWSLEPRNLGEAAAEEESGQALRLWSFLITDFGYVTPNGYNPVEEKYRSVQDIPSEYIVSAQIAKAEQPAPLMELYAVEAEIAKKLLALGYADVYNLSKSGAMKLEQMDALNTNLWKSPESEFAVRRGDLPALDRLKARESAEHSKIKISVKKRDNEER